MSATDTSIYEQERRAKLNKLRELGVDPYGGRVDGIEPLAAAKARLKPEMGHDGGPPCVVSGRIVLKRDMGKLSFLTLRDDSGDLQVAVDRKRVDDTSWQIRNLLDLADRVVVRGKLGTTNKGEPTVWADSLSIAAKSLIPPPSKYEGLMDVDQRYRQRYVDLWSNPEVMQVAHWRIKIVSSIREFLLNRGFLEVETPMLQTLHGGAAARPFVTHHNALDMRLYMRIAPELFLKRLLVAGMPKVFEINRNFRNEGISPRHNPEFTMLEAYEAFGDYRSMAALVEDMICHVAMQVFGKLTFEHVDSFGNTRTIDLSRRPWPRRPMVDLVHEATGWKFDKDGLKPLDIDTINESISLMFRRRIARRIQDVDHFAGSLLLKAKSSKEFNEFAPYAFERLKGRQAALLREIENVQTLGKELPSNSDVLREETARLERESKKLLAILERISDFISGEHFKQEVAAFAKGLAECSPAEQLVYLYEKIVEPTLINPCFVTRVPSVIIPLARKCPDDEFFADVYELAINGQEISPGYTELNDPDVQAENFRHQVGDKAEQQQVDEDFLTALKYGMPPAGGIGLGIDRLVMMLTGAESIRDVILFPLMRPEHS